MVIITYCEMWITRTIRWRNYGITTVLSKQLSHGLTNLTHIVAVLVDMVGLEYCSEDGTLSMVLNLSWSHDCVTTYADNVHGFQLLQ